MSATEYLEIFREEAGELLEELEAGLLELEETPTDLKLVGRIFRAMHTIKGSSAMFGLDDIADFTHHVETVLDKVRDGAVPVSKELIDLTLASRDHIRNLLAATESGEAIEGNCGEGIIVALQALTQGAPAEEAVTSPAATTEPVAASAPAVAETPAVPESEEQGGLVHYLVRVEPTPAFPESGVELEPILAGLDKLGEWTKLCDSLDAPAQEGGAESPYLDLLISTTHGMNAVKDHFIFIESTCKVTVIVAGEADEGETGGHKRLGEILIERGDISEEALSQALAQQKPLGEILVENRLVAGAKVQSALAAQREIGKQQAAKAAPAVDSIRVAADKLDRLIDLVGELVVTQARLTEIASDGDNPALGEPVEEVERLTAELRDSVLTVRMLAIGTTFGKFRRLVRDLSAELGKEVRMVTEGEDTELDKTMIERLSDPLVHLIRNCIDHGIEPPEERQAKGKPRQGTIRLVASHAGAQVLIRVIDDGRGLDREEIRAKAVAKGLIKPEAELSDSEIYGLIFAAGLSTAAAVSSVSGRGVGMDVVMSTIKGMKGKVHVSSEPGRGTTVSISLPLTLAIIDGLLVKAGETHFVLPLAQVEECVELTSEDAARFHGRRLLPVRDQLVPYVRLRDFFAISGTRPEIEQLVIIQSDGERSGLVLDEVIGEHQTVIKSLGWAYRNAEGVSGATILGNGEVALIMDVAAVIKGAGDAEGAMVQ